jgi:hypothetical protein
VEFLPSSISDEPASVRATLTCIQRASAHTRRFGALCSLTICASAAHALEEPPPVVEAPAVVTDLPVGDAPAGSLVIVVGDQSGTQVEPPLRARLDFADRREETVLQDDGVAPDHTAGDATYTGAVASHSAGWLGIEVTDSGGRKLWVDALSIHDAEGTSRVAALLTPTGVRISVDSAVLRGGSRVVPLPDNPPSPGTESAPDAAPERSSDAGARDPSPGSDVPTPDDERPRAGAAGRSAGPLGSLVALALGLLAGLGAPPVLRWYRRPRVRLQRIGAVGPEPGLPGVPPLRGHQQVWVLPDADDVRRAFLALAGELSKLGPVLLVPRQAHRDALAESLAQRPNAYWLDRDRPESGELLQAAEELGAAPGPVILVEGPGALERTLEYEEPGAVLAELLDAASDGRSLLVLCQAEELRPDRPRTELRLTDEGLETAAGVLVLNLPRISGAG